MDAEAAKLLGAGLAAIGASFERVFISYALSMIPEWEMALVQAARCVAPGGKLEIVDFGQQDELPALWKRALFGWLERFHVSPRRELNGAINRLAQDMGGFPHVRMLYRGYAVRGGLIRV
jgi:S-adenosylmethionine-diacylgycerolhomoserine-N-methlytransferase